MARDGRRGGDGPPPHDDDPREWPPAEQSRESELFVRPGDMPYNIEAEAALLGVLMIDNRLVDEFYPKLQPEHFFEPVHARIYEKIVTVVHSERVASPVTLRPYFELDTEMAQLGGPGYLAELTGSGAGIIGARDFASQIRDLAMLRQVIDAAINVARRALDTSEEMDAAALLADIDAELSEIGISDEKLESTPFAEAWDEVNEEFMAMQAGAEPAGFTIDLFRDWNAVVGRMEEEDLIYLGARPSMGKTGVAIAVALGAAAAGHATEFFSLEQQKRKITRRAMAHLIYEQGVTSPYQDIIVGKLTMDDVRAMAAARTKLADWPLNIAAPKNMYVEDLPAEIRRRQRALSRKGQVLKLVVVDYLGRLKTRRKFDNETAEVSYISRMLKETFAICKVTGVVLVQLSRALEARPDKRPMLADLRQSGGLEQDADTVVFLYRDEYYHERAEPPKAKEEKWNKWADELAAMRDMMEIYSSKRREGPLLKRTAWFFTNHQAVRDHDFFSWKARQSPIGPQDDDGLFPGPDMPERRG